MDKQSFSLSGFAFSILSFIINPVGAVSILAIVFSSIGLKERHRIGGHGFCVSGLCAGIITLLLKLAELFY